MNNISKIPKEVEKRTEKEAFEKAVHYHFPAYVDALETKTTDYGYEFYTNEFVQNLWMLWGDCHSWMRSQEIRSKQ